MPAANLRRARTARNLSLSELSQLEADAADRRSSRVPLPDPPRGGGPTVVCGAEVEVLRGDGVAVVRGAEVEVVRGDGVDLRPLRGTATDDTVVEVYDQRVRSRQESLGHVGTEHPVSPAGGLRVRVDDRDVGPRCPRPRGRSRATGRRGAGGSCGLRRPPSARLNGWWAPVSER
ncbi:hypothetical protein [Actinoallomurus iriomotensis]|uniref:Uncharacterized protein n=1 Tax=Actinoallomurus iriomotensis TaxID=478107 RepID=A0A9W6W1C5_9ACTN|nr:hypothetical protein [Actinoallomurus iriomotensis]GLY85821.1 hypothetical protein Airi02_037500 [Actinoallomurus iriomotensis]